MYHLRKTILLGVTYDSVRIAIIGDPEQQNIPARGSLVFKVLPMGLCSPNLLYSRGYRIKETTSFREAHRLCTCTEN